ncbi:maltose acetyltransferase domain-containing protein [Methanoculleus sp.]
MTEKERMLSGKLYVAQDEELKRDNLRARRLTRLFNGTTEEELE